MFFRNLKALRCNFPSAVVRALLGARGFLENVVKLPNLLST